MWAITTAGIFSVVKNLRRGGTVMVRSRRREDLEGIRRRFKVRARVIDTPAADYPHRLVVPAGVWRRIASGLAGDAAGYHNFKAAVEKVEGHGSARADALHEIWAVLRDLEDLEAGRTIPRPRWRRDWVDDDGTPNPHGWGKQGPAPASGPRTVTGFVPRMVGPTIAAGGQDDE